MKVKIKQQDLEGSDFWEDCPIAKYKQRLNRYKKDICAVLTKRRHIQKLATVQSEKCGSLEEQLKYNMFAGFVDYILCDITGLSVIELDAKRRYDLENFTQEIKEKLTTLSPRASQMIVGEAVAIGEVLNGMLDQIDNTIMNKMVESMKILTAFAAIFLPRARGAGIT